MPEVLEVPEVLEEPVPEVLGGGGVRVRVLEAREALMLQC